MKIKLLLIFFTLLITSFSPKWNLNNLIGIQKGMTIEKVENTLLKRVRYNTKEVISNNITYTLLTIKVINEKKMESSSTSVYTQTLKSTSTGAHVGGYKTVNENTLESLGTDYIICFENDKAIYWGFLYEFLRHSNNKIENIGLNILAKNEELK